MRQWAGILCLMVPVFLSAQQSSHNGAPKYAPDDGKTLLVIGQDLGAVGGLDQYDDGYVDWLNHVPSGVTTYTGFPGLGGLTEMDNWGAGDVLANAYVEDSTFDNSVIVIGLYLVDQLGSIISGSSDPQIQELGGWIKAQERPVFLRIGYEFDGSWHHYDPEQYKEAWIYMVDFFDALGVTNVAYVWQAYGGNTPNIDRWYPGDNYVNWVGYSHFNEINPGANILDLAEVHDKPVMIAEATPKVDLKTGSGTDHWNNWYNPLFDKIYANDRIKALAYINVDWESQPMWTGQGWGDSRVEVNDVVKGNWMTEILKDSWILASDSLFHILEYNLWEDSIVGLIEPDPATKGELKVISNANRLIVKLDDDTLLNGISIWDVSGRLLFRNEEAAFAYRIPASLFAKTPVLILHVQMGDQVLRKKAVLI